MINDWFRKVSWAGDWSTFQALPRHPAYRYEFRHGVISISPAPRFQHALLSLFESRMVHDESDPNVSLRLPSPRIDSGLRRMQPGDWPQLPSLMARAFAGSPPLAMLSASEQLQAAGSLLERCRTGGDGPLVEAAAFVIDPGFAANLQAAVLVTLTPNGSLEDFNATEWTSPAPPDAIERRWGMPHLTWVFVDPLHRRRGLAETLLRAAQRELEALGYTHLASTFLVGDNPSASWHWRMGFRLLSQPDSPRHLHDSL